MKRRLFLTSSIGALGVIAADCGAQPEVVRSGGRGQFDATIENLAAKLESEYVIPATGARYAAMLRANLSRGKYLDFGSASQLAGQLTAELRAIAPDGHLRVVTEDEGIFPPGAEPVDGQRRRLPPDRVPIDRNAGPDAPGLGPPREVGLGSGPQPRRLDPIEDAKWIADEIAYIRFNELPGTPQSVAVVAQFMRDHATARAMIFDARTLRGGGMAEMDIMLPYLYSRETTLVVLEVARRFEEARPQPEAGAMLRVANGPRGMSWREHFVVPHPTEHRLFDAQVFYLTSVRTASAGEHLALALKRTHRATLVGGRTAGGNHFGGFEELGLGLSAFIPIGRTLDPDTGQDWEGIGIQPDVEVAADTALDEAMRRASA
jgi:hypothetical protein